MAGSGYRAGVGALIAASMVFSSTAATASAPSIAQPDPWAALSVMSGGASAAAVCGAAAAAAAAQPRVGCVLPQLGSTPLAAGAPPPPYYTASSTPPIPVLLVWAAVLGAMIYILTRHHRHHPNSPA